MCGNIHQLDAPHFRNLNTRRLRSGSRLLASTLQTPTATFGCVAKIEANFTSHFGGTLQSSSVIAATEPLVSVRPALSALPLPTVAIFHVPQARIGAQWLWGPSDSSFLIKDDQLEIGMPVRQDGQYSVRYQVTAMLVQTNADIGDASSCLNCPPTDVANYCSTSAGRRVKQ